MGWNGLYCVLFRWFPSNAFPTFIIQVRGKNRPYSKATTSMRCGRGKIFISSISQEEFQYLACMKISIQLRQYLWCMYFWLGMRIYFLCIFGVSMCAHACYIFTTMKGSGGCRTESGVGEWVKMGSTCNGMHLLWLGKLLNWYYVNERAHSWPAKCIITEYYI